MNDSKRALVIGAGYMGRKHAAAWLSELGAGQVGVLVRHDGDQRRVERWGLDGLATVTSTDWLRQTDWASVCTPTDSHAEVGVPLLRSGVHVIVEKPLAGDIDGADALLLAGFGRCFVAHTCRAEAPAIAVMDRVDPSEVREVAIERRERHRPLPDGTPVYAEFGRLFDVLVHDIASVIDVLPGGEPTAESSWDAATSTLSAVWRWQAVTLTLREARRAPEAGRRVEIEGRDHAWGWELGAGSQRVWGGLHGREADIDVNWGDPTTAIIKACRGALETGDISPFDAAVGGRVMRLAARALAALEDEPFGEAFDWDYVR